LFFDNAVQLTFIEPQPENRLSTLIREQDQQYATVHAQRLQELTTTPWDQLQAKYFLFIDSSHVSKYGSEVNHVCFAILPTLPPGVIVHIHDVFKLAQLVSKKWRRLNCHEKITLVIEGRSFKVRITQNEIDAYMKNSEHNI